MKNYIAAMSSWIFSKIPTLPFLAVLLCMASAQAVNYSWAPTGVGNFGGSGTWSTSALSWDNGTGSLVAWATTGASGNDAFFGGSDGNHTVTLTGNIGNTGNLNFTASGYTLQSDGATMRTINVGQSNFSVSTGNNVTIGSNLTISRNSTAIITGGGTLSITTGGVFSQGATNNSLSILNGTTVIVGGGSLSVAGNSTVGLRIGEATGPGTSGNTLTLASGTVTTTGANAGIGLTMSFGSGTVNLDGGTLTTGIINNTTGATGNTFNFNGGTLKVGNSTNAVTFMTGLSAANVKEGGAKIDTNGFDVTVGQALLHGGAAATDGGLVKSGNGILTLTGVNSYTGNTVVNAGTLLLADNAGLTFVISSSRVNNGIDGAGTVTLDGDFTFDLSGAGTTAGDNWTIVDVESLSASFGGTFSVVGFTESSNVWTSGNYQFSEATGVLSVVPEPATWLMLAFAGVFLVVHRHRGKSRI